jgi:hypothetical protein
MNKEIIWKRTKRILLPLTYCVLIIAYCVLIWASIYDVEFSQYSLNGSLFKICLWGVIGIFIGRWTYMALKVKRTAEMNREITDTHFNSPISKVEDAITKIEYVIYMISKAEKATAKAKIEAKNEAVIHIISEAEDTIVAAKSAATPAIVMIFEAKNALIEKFYSTTWKVISKAEDSCMTNQIEQSF